LDTVVLLLVDVIGSIVISLSRCCLPNDEGASPPPKKIFFPRTALSLSNFAVIFHGSTAAFSLICTARNQ